MSKHYIRVDLEGRIIKGYSDYAEFNNVVLDTDICINENGGTQFEMLGLVNPNLMNEQFVYIYKYVDEVVMNRTEEEIQADIDNLPTPEPTESQRLSTIEDTTEVLLTQILPMLTQ